jgi:hypothetical protein
MSDAWDGGATTDSTVARLLHDANRPAAAGQHVPVSSASPLSPEEQAVVDSAEEYLGNGIALLEWWRERDRRGDYAERFELERSFNQASSSFGFFGDLQLGGSRMPVMGNVQEMLYDSSHIPTQLSPAVGRWIRKQVREFALRYFMRISDFRQPESAESFLRPAPPPGFGRLSWCPDGKVLHQGFGFTQLFYKERATGVVARFPEDRSSAIVDLRELGTIYDYIIVKVRIFDFDVGFRPFGDDGPELVFSLNEESYLVLSRELVTNHDDPEPGVLGDYAIGYAFIKSPQSGFLAYGPGRFDAAVEIIRFRVLSDGQVRVHMLFVANRPGSIATVSVDPIDWAIWSADWVSNGMASQILRPLRDMLDRRPVRLGTFDPVYTYVDLVNGLSAGWAAQRLCVSRVDLDKQFLVQHFTQHYQAIVGSLLTWRQISDWTDERSLPRWVITGGSK